MFKCCLQTFIQMSTKLFPLSIDSQDRVNNASQHLQLTGLRVIRLPLEMQVFFLSLGLGSRFLTEKHNYQAQSISDIQGEIRRSLRTSVSPTQNFTSTVAHKVLFLLEGQDRKQCCSPSHPEHRIDGDVCKGLTLRPLHTTFHGMQKSNLLFFNQG